MSGESKWREDGRTVIERNKFFASTTLAGFGYIYKSNSRVEIIFWYFTIIFFTALTIHNVYDLTIDFISDATVTVVSMEKLNETYDLGFFRLGLKLPLPELHPEFQVKYDTKAFDWPNYAISLETEVENALSKLGTKEKLQTVKWDYILLTLLSRYSGFFTLCEFQNRFCANPPFAFKWEREAVTGKSMKIVNEQIKKVINHSRALHVNNDELIQLLGKNFRQWVNLRMESPKGVPIRFDNRLSRVWGTYPQPEGTILLVFEIKTEKLVPIGRAVYIMANITHFVSSLVHNRAMSENSSSESADRWKKAHESVNISDIDESLGGSTEIDDNSSIATAYNRYMQQELANNSKFESSLTLNRPSHENSSDENTNKLKKEESEVKIGHPVGPLAKGDKRSFENAYKWYREQDINSKFRRASKWYLEHEPEMMIQLGGFNSRKRTIHCTIDVNPYWSLEVVSAFHGLRRCLAGKSKNRQCVYNCTRDVIVKRCNCSPLLVPDQDSTKKVKLCRPIDYIKCSGITQISETIFDNCTTSCLPDCQVEFLDIQLNSQSPDNHEAGDMLEIAFDILTNQYPIFIQKDARTWQGFLADLGGTFDFWLGASVVAMVHLLCYVLKQMAYMFMNTTKTGLHVRKGVRRMGRQFSRRSSQGLTNSMKNTIVLDALENYPFVPDELKRNQNQMEMELNQVKSQLKILMAQKHATENGNCNSNATDLENMVKEMQIQIAELQTDKKIKEKTYQL